MNTVMDTAPSAPLPALNTLDLAILVLLLWSLLRGFQCGFVRSLIAPLSMLVGLFYAMMNYDLTDNLIEAAMIFTGVAVGGAVALRLLLWLGRLGLDEDQRRRIPAFSRMSGAIVNTVWNGSVVLIVFSVAHASLQNALPPAIMQVLDESRLVRFAEAKIMPAVPVLRKTQQTLTVVTDPDFARSLAADPDFKAFRSHPAVKNVIEDPDIQRLIAGKQVIDLLRHPKIRRLLEDDDLMREFSRTMEKHYQDSLKNR